MSDAIPRPQLITIGCSAGGVEALSKLVSTFRTPFPAPIVVAQHLDPKRPSHLAEVLSRRSTLPIVTLTGRSPLEPGVIYLVPSGRNVEITDHDVQLSDDDGKRPWPSVDMLFRSAADVYGENLIAVILTGTGSDGSTGARHVKQHGGTVVIENPDTASFPGMPGSLAPNTVDIIADIERIGPLLYELITGTYVETQPDEAKRLQTLLDLVRDQSGIDFKKYKQATIQRRLRRRIAATETQTIEGYARYLLLHPEEYQKLINSFLIKVTEFMRDPDLFAHLKDAVLPDLVSHARQDGKSLRIWSAGCATGEEAYSLAILISEILGNELDDFNVRIFSTDIDSDAIAFARRGMYAPSAVEELPVELVERHFVRSEGRYQINKRLRNLTVFGEHDLGQRAPFPHIDLVLCRNVLIYFTTELQRRTLQLFAFALRDGGYLALGKAETTSPLSDFFSLHDVHQKVYVRRGERVVIPPARVGPPPKLTLRTRGIPLQMRVPKDLPRIRIPIDSLLGSLPFGVVFVDSRYDVQEINVAARRLLGIHGSAFGQDFVHLAQVVPHRVMLAAIDAALRGETPDPIEVAVESGSPGAPMYLQLVCHPQQGDTDAPKSPGVLILIQDVTPAAQKQRETERLLARESAEKIELARAMANAEAERAGLRAENEGLRRQNAERVSAMERVEAERQEDRETLERLKETNQRVVRANEELTAAHEHLRAANEELMLSSEEAQASMEEIETLNEEFQATNEELETVNEELQSTIEELNTTNADLEARSQEIRELAASVEADRTRLSAILRSMGDGLLVVNAAGRPLLTNDAYQQMFGQVRGSIYDEKGKVLPVDQTPEQRAARGEKFQMEFTRLDSDGAMRHFEATGQPIGSAVSDVLEGTVIVIRDITERSIRKQQGRFMAMASHELRTPLVPLHGYLDMLLHLLPKEGVDERLRRYATLARGQGQRLERLVDDLMNATRIQTGKFQLRLAPLDLGPLVAHAVELSQMHSESCAIHADLPATPAEPLRVNGDAARLEQVVQNLLGNAFRHAGASPRIDVRLRRVEGAAELEVEDYGRGIPADDLPRVFSSFYQVERSGGAAEGGLGLGLFICQEIIKAHGGEISVRSEEGKGTLFTIRLPLMPQQNEHD